MHQQVTSSPRIFVDNPPSSDQMESILTELDQGRVADIVIPRELSPLKLQSELERARGRRILTNGCPFGDALLLTMRFLPDQSTAS